MAKPLLTMLAAGGHARVVLDTLQCDGKSVQGILDPTLPKGQHLSGVSVIGDDAWLDTASATSYHLVNGAGAIPRSQLRRSLYNRVKQLGFAFASVVHPTSIICGNIELFEGAQVMAGAIVQYGRRVGIML